MKIIIAVNTIGPFEWLFLSSKFFRQKGQRSFKKNSTEFCLSHFIDDGKKSNSQSGRIITKRKNVTDENSHLNGPIDSMLKKLYRSSRNLPNSNSPCSQNKAAIGFGFTDCQTVIPASSTLNIKSITLNIFNL